VKPPKLDIRCHCGVEEAHNAFRAQRAGMAKAIRIERGTKKVHQNTILMTLT